MGPLLQFTIYWALTVYQTFCSLMGSPGSVRWCSWPQGTQVSWRRQMTANQSGLCSSKCIWVQRCQRGGSNQIYSGRRVGGRFLKKASWRGDWAGFWHTDEFAGWLGPWQAELASVFGPGRRSLKSWARRCSQGIGQAADPRAAQEWPLPYSCLLGRGRASGLCTCGWVRYLAIAPQIHSTSICTQRVRSLPLNCKPPTSSEPSVLCRGIRAFQGRSWWLWAPSSLTCDCRSQLCSSQTAALRHLVLRCVSPLVPPASEWPESVKKADA